MKRSILSSTISFGAVFVALASPATAEPLGGAVIGGGATIGSAGKTTTISQSTDKAIIEWQSFNIAGNEKVKFVQPSDAAIALNRVLGAGPSIIDGQIDANGRVFIINGDGVAFGAGSKIDVNGILATSTDIGNSNFMAGSFVFNQPGSPTAAIINHGAINAADAGMIAFVAPTVQNSGLLAAKLGTVALGSGEAFTLDFFGDQLIAFAAVNTSGSKTGQILVDGAIHAESGTILLTATSARDFVDTVINVEADLVARSAIMKGGKIILAGGSQSTINVDATLDAVGTPGGAISVSGGVVNVSQNAKLLTDAKTGLADGGNIVVNSTQQTNFAGLASSEPGASSGVGGDISIASNGVLIFTGTARAGTPPRAGMIDLNGVVDNSGGNSGGGGNSGTGGSGGNNGNGPPTVIPGPPVKNDAANRLTEVIGEVGELEQSVEAGKSDEAPGAQVLVGDNIAFDYSKARDENNGDSEARLMCVLGVSAAACVGGR